MLKAEGFSMSPFKNHHHPDGLDITLRMMRRRLASIEAHMAKSEETELQIAFMDWFRGRRFNNAVAFHIANERRCGKRMGALLKRMGVLPGVPDVCVLLPEGRTLWIEFKSPHGRLTTPQQVFSTICNRLGHSHVVVRSLSEAASHVMGMVNVGHSTSSPDAPQ
jgi:hypothetical protein